MITKEKLGLAQEEWEVFEKSRAKTQCEKNFQCIYSEIEMLCKAKYRPDLDIIECIEETMADCKFSKPFSSTHVCTCPMRKFFARHFNKWMEKASDQDA
jgi:hypothetical protein